MAKWSSRGLLERGRRGYSPRKVDWKRRIENTEAEGTELEEPTRLACSGPTGLDDKVETTLIGVECSGQTGLEEKKGEGLLPKDGDRRMKITLLLDGNSRLELKTSSIQ